MVLLLWIICVFSVLCLLCLCARLFICTLWSTTGKGLGSGLWCLVVSLSLSHWYPGSGVVLDCIDSWSLHSYLDEWGGGGGVSFADFISFFVNSPCKWKNVVSNYFMFMGYLKGGGGVNHRTPRAPPWIHRWCCVLEQGTLTCVA